MISKSGQFKKGQTPWNRGIPQSKEQKKRHSKNMMGKIPWNKGKKGIHISPKTEFKKGEHCGENHFNFKGGKKLKIARQNSKRKQFGFIPLNECLVDGWVGHHLDYNYVIYIPEELHKSIYHSVSKDRNMNIINDKVYEWFVNYYFRRN